MAKVTSKLQLTVPKAIADQYGIRPGDELEWMPAGEVIRVILARATRKKSHKFTIKQRLELFDRATERQRQREEALGRSAIDKGHATARGWTREDLYRRGLSD
jgi:AbrB family looped-hinge helix DNA binding protein